MAFVALLLLCPSARYCAVLYHPCTKITSYYLRVVACVCVHLTYPRCAVVSACNGLHDILHDIDEPRGLVPVYRAYGHCHRKPGRINCNMQLCDCNVSEPAVSYAAAPFLITILKESTDLASRCALLLLLWVALTVAATSIFFHTQSSQKYLKKASEYLKTA